MRCFLMRGGHIGAVEFLTATDDEGRIAEARRLFETSGRARGADGFEVWDGPRFVYRFGETGHSAEAFNGQNAAMGNGEAGSP